MTPLYKLTDQDHKTRAGHDNETQWGDGVEHSAKGDAGQDLCSDGWLHAYTDPLLAVLLNTIHADIEDPVLWEAEGDVGKSDDCKVGCRTLRTVRVVPLPKITTEQRVKFAILCAKRVCADEKWNAWADAWLSGKDRSYEAARAEAEAEVAADAARAALWAARAARAAAAEARVAAEAAEARTAARTAAMWGASAAARAARAAARAAGKNIDLAAIAKEAVR